jgi:cytoskeletal protein CcmA (bactofilin family)
MADAPDAPGLLVKSVSVTGSVAIPPRSGEAPRRLGDFAHPPKSDDGSRCLSVGRGITLSGEVASCDKLFIEGSVEANLTNCRIIEIAESGVFKGSTTIEEAEVRGRFEGDLVVHNRLLIKATGRVSGTLRYGQIEIECGGQIFGDIQPESTSDAQGKAPWLSSPLDEAPPSCHPIGSPATNYGGRSVDRRIAGQIRTPSLSTDP